MGTTANILFDLEIENTLFVSKNGNDSLAERGNWNQPFLTIFAAKSAAQTGDTIFVFPGEYNEGSSDIIASDVKYWFELGSKVISNFECISDFGVAKNIHVDGFGDFQELFLNFSKGAVVLNNPSSTLFLRCRELVGRAQAISINNCATYDIKCSYATCVNQYVATIRGNSEGSLEIDDCEQQSGAAQILYRNLGTDLVARTHYLKIGVMRGNCNGQGMVTTINTFNTITICEIGNMQTTGAGRLFNFWTGQNFVKNTNGNAPIGAGVWTEIGSSVNLFKDCNFISTLFAVVAVAGSSEFENCQLITNRLTNTSGGSVAMNINGTLSLSDCLVVMNTLFVTPKCINLNNGGNPLFNFRMKRCKLVGSPSMTESIGNNGSGLGSFYVNGSCSSNVATGAGMTNVVAGTNVAVDPNIGRNAQNFFE